MRGVLIDVPLIFKKVELSRSLLFEEMIQVIVCH